MEKNSRIYVAGHKGLVGSSLVRTLESRGYTNIITRTRGEVDLTDQRSVEDFFYKERPEYVFDAAARVGGIHANATYPAEFIYQNLQIQTNLIHASSKYEVKKFMFLGSVCFPAGTVVLTKKGIKNIEDVDETDWVLTHKRRFRKVIKTTTNLFNKELVTIKLHGWNKIVCTPDHLIYTTRGFIAAKELITSDFVKIPLVEKTKQENSISEDLAELCGYFVSEGCIRQISTGKRGSSHTIFFYPGYDEKFKNDICSKIMSVYGVVARQYKKRTSWQICLSGDDFCNFFKSFYFDELVHKAHTKYIPSSIMDASNNIISHFLKGYWKGNGHWKKRKDRSNNQYFCTASSTSKILIYQLQQLLLKLKIFSTIYYHKKSSTCIIEGRTVNQKSSWELKIVGNDAIKFLKEIMNESIDDFIPSYKPRNVHVFNDNFLEVKVNKIIHHSSSEPVYDLSVDEDYSYTSNGIAVHNCIYPKYAPVPVKEEYLLTGELEPSNQWYATAKIAGIKMCQAYRRQYSRDFVSVMPCNLYGVNDNFHPTNSHVLPALIRRFVEAKEQNLSSVTCWGTGMARREFMYVDDMTDACIFIMDNYSDESIINIGMNVDYTIKESAELIKKIVGYEGELLWDTTKPDGTPKRMLDSTKLFNLGWRPKVSLEEGLTKSIEWFKEWIYSTSRI